MKWYWDQYKYAYCCPFCRAVNMVNAELQLSVWDPPATNICPSCGAYVEAEIPIPEFNVVNEEAV